jgi:hypothetical protein
VNVIPITAATSLLIAKKYPYTDLVSRRARLIRAVFPTVKANSGGFVGRADVTPITFGAASKNSFI